MPLNPALPQVPNPFAVGRYYHAGPQPNATTKLTEAEVRLMPFVVPVTQAFDRIAVESTVGGAAGAIIRLGIFRNNSGLVLPLVLDAGTAVATGTGKLEKTIAVTLDPDLYWLAVVCQGASGDPVTLRSTNADSGGEYLGLIDPLNQWGSSLVKASVSGAFAATITVTADGAGTGPEIHLRAA